MNHNTTPNQNTPSPVFRYKAAVNLDLSDFEILSPIGSGSFGTVFWVKRKDSNQEYALKVIEKSRLSGKALQTVLSEASTLGSLNHHNIVRFYQMIENKENICIVMELIRSGSLYEELRKRTDAGSCFSDEEASKIIGSLLAAISYIHRKNIVHRDIKPQNVLIADKKDLKSIKLIDFGLSCHFNDYFIKVFSQKCGTLLYMAPELLKGELYSKPVDIWSTGILMMELLNSGKHPFDAGEKNTKAILIEKILHPIWTFSQNFSSLSKDLFLKLTNPDPQNRYTADQALTHPWITRRFNENIPLTFNENLRLANLQAEFANKVLAVFFMSFLKMKQGTHRHDSPKKVVIVKKAIKNNILRSSKTVEISNENSRDDSASSPKDYHETTFTDAIIQHDEDSLLTHENFVTLLNASPSKRDFRIKNIAKPFNSLNTALMNFSTPKALIGTQEIIKERFPSSPKKESSTSNSPKNLSPNSNKKKRSKFGEEINGEKPGLTLTMTEIEGKKSNNITPTSDSVKKYNGFGEKKEKVKIKVIVSPNHMSQNFSSINLTNMGGNPMTALHSNNNTITNFKDFKDPKESPIHKEQDKRFSIQEAKKLENIRLDKETLRDLNRYTDKNFIKSIKASLRKLEIIEKISEDNFREGDRVQMTMSQSPNKRHSTNESKARFLPLITPDNSPKKPVFMKNSRLPKN